MWREKKTALLAQALPSVGLTLAAGLALLAVAVGVVMSSSPVAVIGANSTLANGSLAQTYSAAGACQPGEDLPAGTSAIRLTLESDIGPRVGVRALSGTHVLTSGAVGSGWTGGSVTVPVRPVARTSSHVRICFEVGPTKELVAFIGAPTSPAVAATDSEGKALPGRIKIEYLRADRSSWWSVAPTVARRMGLGRAPAGTWIVLLLVALMGTAIAGASWLTLRELR